MKKMNNRIFSLIMVLLLVFSLLPGVTLTANAATVDYQYADTEKYDDVIVNWGIRGEPATFLSPNAEKFYSDTTYDELIVLDAGPLYTTLFNLMSSAHANPTKYDQTVDAYRLTDCQNNGEYSSTISGFYSGQAISPKWDGGLTWNREHTWPQSKTTKGSEVHDIMSIRPESSTVNSGRGDTAYGESSGFYNPNKSSSYDVRGDAARVILYTYVRWGGESSMSDTIKGKLWGKEGVFESETVLLKWIKEDPVDTWEMARNDSVESITGTRNVFVDYPELAFALFDKDIPDMDTPSGEADHFAYTINATSNNTTYGTVSVNHNHVTAYPKAGYRVSGYKIVSGNASVVRNADVFTVTASGNCSIQIQFEKAPSYTAKFLQDGKQVSYQTAMEGNCITMPEFSGSLPIGYTFRGWVDSIVYNTPTMPAQIYAAGSEYTLQSNITFYALLSWTNMNDTSAGELTYKLVTKADQLVPGSKIILAAAGYDKALSTTQNNNNRGASDIIKSNNSLVFADNSGVQVLTLETGMVSGTFALKANSGYLYAASNSNNWLRTKSVLDENGSFAITVKADGSCTIIAQGSNAKNNLQYNQQNNIFACYSTVQKPVSLYVGEQGGTTYYTMAWSYTPEDPTDPTEPTTPAEPDSCSHTDTSTVTVDATCTVNGSVTVSCNTCGEVISVTTIPAGHKEAEEIVPPTLSSEGYTRYYCTVCGDEYFEDYTNALTNIKAWNLTLGSDLSVNFQINVDASIRSTAQVKIKVANETTTYNVSSLAESASGVYSISVKLAAVQMTDEIAVQIVNGNDQTEAMTYTVKNYADAILAGNYAAATQNLVEQMLRYGAAAQVYFGYHTERLADADLDDASFAAPATTNASSFRGSAEGISYAGATLVFRDKIALRYYFDVTGDIGDYTFTKDGTALKPVQKGDLYYVEIGDLNPQDLDNLVTIQVNGTLTATYSPANYMVNMNQKGSQSLQILVQALYAYHLAAEAYLAA